MTASEKIKLENRIKSFVSETLEEAKKDKNYAFGSRNQAYGVIFFSCNNLFDTYNEELADWWDEEILPQFNEIIRGAKKCI